MASAGPARCFQGGLLVCNLYAMLYNMVDKSDDALRTLGLTALGSRLKRLGDRLQAEAQAILSRVEPAIASGQHPLLHTIDRFAPLTIGELAERLGVTQPGVTRTLGQLAEAGLVEVVIAPRAQEPEPQVAEDLEQALQANAQALATWRDITAVARRDWIQWITSGKKAETRGKRISSACDMLAKGKRRACCFDRSGIYSKAFAAPEAAP